MFPKWYQADLFEIHFRLHTAEVIGSSPMAPTIRQSIRTIPECRRRFTADPASQDVFYFFGRYFQGFQLFHLQKDRSGRKPLCDFRQVLSRRLYLFLNASNFRTQPIGRSATL